MSNTTEQDAPAQQPQPTQRAVAPPSHAAVSPPSKAPEPPPRDLVDKNLEHTMMMHDPETRTLIRMLEAQSTEVDPFGELRLRMANGFVIDSAKLEPNGFNTDEYQYALTDNPQGKKPYGFILVDRNNHGKNGLRGCHVDERLFVSPGVLRIGGCVWVFRPKEAAKMELNSHIAGMAPQGEIAPHFLDAEGLKNVQRGPNG